MNISLKNIALLVGVLLLGIGIYYSLFVKGGIFSAELPKPVNIDLGSAPVENFAESQPAGEVLGESENSTQANPLKDIYVNPFGN